MAYVSPSTRASNAIVTASIWNQDVVANVQYLAENRPRARVYNSAAQSVPNSSNTTVTFDSERYDIGGLHSTSSNTGRLTAPVNGTYMIGGHIVWASNATGVRSVWVELNGATRIASNDANNVTANELGVTVTTQWQMTAGDYVELKVFQTSGGALNVQQYAGRSLEFWMSLVSPT